MDVVVVGVKLINDIPLMQRRHLPLTHRNVQWVLRLLRIELLLRVLLLELLVQTENVS